MKFSKVITLCLVIAIFGCSTPRILKDTAIMHFNSGVTAFESGLYTKAKHEFEMAIKFHPFDEVIWAGEHQEHKLNNCARGCDVTPVVSGDFKVSYQPNAYLNKLQRLTSDRLSVVTDWSLVNVELALSLEQDVDDGYFEAGEHGYLVLKATNRSRHLIDGYMVELRSDRSSLVVDKEVIHFGVVKAGQTLEQRVKLFNDVSGDSGAVVLTAVAHDALGRLVGNKSSAITIERKRYQNPEITMTRKAFGSPIRAAVRNSVLYEICNSGEVSAYDLSLQISGRGVVAGSAKFVPDSIYFLPAKGERSCREVELIFTPHGSLKSGQAIASEIIIHDVKQRVLLQDSDLYIDQNGMQSKLLLVGP
jgi:hypothetical protein